MVVTTLYQERAHHHQIGRPLSTACDTIVNASSGHFRELQNFTLAQQGGPRAIPLTPGRNKRDH